MTELKEWHKATEKLTEAFIRKYYVEEDVHFDEIEYDWVGNSFLNVLCIGDDSYSLERIVNALNLDVDYDLLQEYSEFEQLFPDETTPINFNTYVRMSYKNRFQALIKYMQDKAFKDD